MIVDFHSHWYPEAYLQRLVALGRGDLAAARTQSLDLSDRVAEMDRTGVAHQVLSFVGLNVELDEAGAATEACALLNDLYHDAGRRHDGRFLAFAKVPLPFVDAAVAEARRCLDELGFVGIAFPASISGHLLDDPAFDPLWEVLDTRDAIAFIHPVGGDSRAHWGLSDYGLDAMFGSPMQTALAGTRLIFTGVTRRFPRIRFLLAQGGGAMAARWHQMERILSLGAVGHVPAFLGWTKTLDLDPADVMRAFRGFWYDTSLMDSPAQLGLCKETFGAGRMVLGSDTNFGSLTGIVDHVRASPVLSAADRRTILIDNSAALLDGWLARRARGTAAPMVDA